MKRSMLWVMLPLVLALCAGIWFAFAHTEAEGAVAPALVEPPTIPHYIEFETFGNYENVADLESLQVHTEVIEWQDTGWIRKRPGVNESADFTMTCFTDCPDIDSWYDDVRAGTFDRKHLSIILVDGQNTEYLRWNFHDCWPSQMQGAIGYDNHFYLQYVISCEESEIGTW